MNKIVRKSEPQDLAQEFADLSRELGMPEPKQSETGDQSAWSASRSIEGAEKLEQALLEIQEMRILLYAKTSPDPKVRAKAERYDKLKRLLHPEAGTRKTE